MQYEISNIADSEYEEVIDVWEASVRATHHFLTEEDIQYFRPLILNEYLKAVELKCIRDSENRILAFSGVAEDKLEMLFVHPIYFGKGIGKALLEFAIAEQNVSKVDVNEDNPQAVGFYEKCGFVTTSRSELDSSGKPFPILHMELSK